jgi:glutaminase
MTSVLGRSYRAGDENTFTIQSISKPFVYAMVIDELGLEEVARTTSVSSPAASRSTPSASSPTPVDRTTR